MKVVVGYDGSDSAKRALQRVADFAADADQVLVVAAAESHARTGIVKGAHLDPSEIEQRQRNLEEAKQFLAERGIEAETIEAQGDPGAVIVEAAKDADLVVVGTWTDGLVLFGQRPGRSGRLKKLPYITGKKCAVFVTYAVDAGNVLDKLVSMMEDRGGDVIGGMAIRRNDLAGGASDFAGRVLDVVGVS
jgi:nucleotide-binding universal stress UspA family protein